MQKLRFAKFGHFGIAVILLLASCGDGGSGDGAPALVTPVATTLRPTPDGFSFPNFPASATSAVFGDGELFDMFGAQACVDGVASPCVVTAEAAAWARMVNQARIAGHCEGLVVEAADRFDLRKSPPAFELSNDGDITTTIIKKFATQFLPEVQDERGKWAGRSLRNIVNSLGAAFQLGTTPYVLGLYSPRGGHAVLPYAVEFESDNVAIVRVYDSNWPGKNRFVKMDLATNRWTFSFAAPDPLTDSAPWSGKPGDIDLASNVTRAASKCPFCSTDGDSLNSLVVIRAGENDWSITADGVDYTQQNASSDGVVQVRPVLNGAMAAVPKDSFNKMASTPRIAASNTRDFVVVIRNNQNFTVNLKSLASAFIVQASAISQITNSIDELVTVTVAEQSIDTSGGEPTVTVAAADVVVAASGGDAQVQRGGGEITATVTTDTGQTASVTGSVAAPQAAVQVKQSSAGASIVVTTRNRNAEVQVTEISASGSTSVRSSTDGFNLNTTQVSVPPALEEVTVKDALPPAANRTVDNPLYEADTQFVSSSVEVMERREVLAAEISTTTVPVTTTLPLTTTTIRRVPTTTTTTTTVPTTTTTSTTTTTVPTTTTTTATTTTTTTTVVPSTYSVSYNGNTATSGVVPSDVSAYSSSATVTVASNSGILAKTGYTFGGWCTTQPAAGAACSGTSRAAASTFTITAATTLYAQWTLAAPAFTLSSGSESKTQNTAIAGYTISSTGGTIASYAISPSAPTGLTFSTSTGLLSGTPTTVQTATAYTITATNATGSAIQTFTLTVTAATCANGGACIVGDTGPGGGKIFILPSTVGNTTGNYFESALGTWNSGNDKNMNWCNNNNLAFGVTAQGTAIGTGQANTNAIVAVCTTGAAREARAYNGGGLNDWFLPSQSELQQMYTNRVTIGGFVSLPQLYGGGGNTMSYWSSSEAVSPHNPATQAIPVSFTNGGGDNYGKIYGFNVRPVRMFSPNG